MSLLKNYTCHSGGAIGSDYTWGKVAERLGATVNHYYWMQKTPHGNIEISQADKDEGFEKVMLANKKLKRNPKNYMNLLCRNWAQIKYSDNIFAIGTIKNNFTQVDGGTGWAVQMAIDCKKPVYLYDINHNLWFRYNDTVSMFSVIDNMPLLPTNFAGIGTRKITKQAIAAIYELYKNTAEWNFQTKKTNL